ncbi:MAG TPA: hypothetical protein VH143_09185 [Kofleriaceae bacterium]|nr:hypothetical protein [Kofleriaceae bacterium]
MKLRAAIAALVVAAAAQAGPTPKPPHGANRIAIDFSRGTLRGRDKRHYALAWNGTEYRADNGNRVDAALIDALYAALTPARETPEPLDCTSHTDDYPAFVIAIDGDDPVELSSSSNCGAYAPWNIERGGKLYVQFSGAAWQGLAPIFAAVDASWDVAPFDADGGGEVLLALYSPADGASTGDAETCALSLEANVQLRRFFGAPIRVEQLGVSCRLSKGSACGKPQAAGMIAFGAIEVHLELACTNGVATALPHSLDTYKPALGFVASKPVRALVAAMGSATVRLEFDGYSWKLEPNVAGIPALSWVPGDRTIWLHSTGARNDAFWRALAIDPKPLVGSVGGTPVIDEKIDFAGRIVR